METMANRQSELPFEDPKPAAQSKPRRILRLNQVLEVPGLGRSFIYQLQAENLFPQRIKIGAQAVGWIEAEVHQWVEAKITQSRANDRVAKRS